MIDQNSEYLVAAFPFNSEWRFHDAAPMIRKMSEGVLTNRFSMAPLGNATISSSQSKYYGQSAYMDGTGDTLVSLETIDLHDDFTFEAWVRFAGDNSFASDQHFFAVRDDSGNGISLMREAANQNRFAIFFGSTFVTIGGTTSLLNNTWYHLAAVRSGTTMRLYVNGIQEYSGTPASFTVGRRKLSIGGRWNGDYGLNGFIQDARLYSGIAKYSSNFTPPTEIVSYTGDTSGKNTEVLTLPFNSTYRVSDACYRVKDHGSALTTTSFGNTALSSATSKFYGQSVLFDGSGDYLTVPGLEGYTIGLQDFTMEAWVYHLGTADDTLFSDSSACTFTYGAGGKLRFYTGGGSNLVDATPSYISNAWTHIAVVRSNGTLTFYQNGVSAGSHSYNNYINAYSSTPYIGKYYGGTTQDFHGYMQDFRFYIGHAKYTSNFTPATSGISVSKSMSIPNSLALIDSVELTSCNLKQIAFTGIPQDFTHLIAKYSLKTNKNGTSETLNGRFNSDTSNLYSTIVKYGEGSGAGTFVPYSSGSAMHFGYGGAGGTQNGNYNYASSEMTIFAYSESAPTTILTESHYISNSPTGPTAYQSAIQGINSGGYNSSNPVVSIEFFAAEGNPFVEGSTISLYGLK